MVLLVLPLRRRPAIGLGHGGVGPHEILQRKRGGPAWWRRGHRLSGSGDRARGVTHPTEDGEELLNIGVVRLGFVLSWAGLGGREAAIVVVAAAAAEAALPLG